MVFLSDDSILRLISTGELVVHPILNSEQVRGTKIDLRLDNVFHLVQRIALESYNPAKYLNEKPPDYLIPHRVPYGSPFVLHPGELVLAPTFESLKIPTNLLGILDGRSSLARLGVIVHATAGTVDPNFTGPLIVELLNVGRVPVDLYPLMRIGALHLARIEGDILRPYEGKYQGFQNILNPASSLHKDPEWKTICSMNSI